jgi:uncharacterized lipoprotein YddW (UPF0748 family)
MKKLCLLFITLIVLSASYVKAQQFPDPETRGTWVIAKYYKDADAVESMVAKLKAAHFNTIYVCVWYEGYTIYESNVVNNAGGSKQNPSFAGTDPLRTIIDVAHKNGIQVIAWFEYGFSVGYSSSETGLPGILVKHPDWALVRRDMKIIDPDDYGGYFFWVDPSVSAAAQFMVDLYAECAAKYPDLDGIELDRMRYPTTAYSYSDTARARFMSETGNPDPLTLTNTNTAWCAWRREQVTNVVKNIYSAVKAVNPQCVVTGAVAPPYMMYGGSDDKLQAWDIWAKNNYVDMLEPMLYLPVSDYSYQLNLSKNYVPAGFQLSPGIAISSTGSVSNTFSEIRTTRNASTAGEVIWYYGDLLNYADALPQFQESIYPEPTSPSFNDLVMDNYSKGMFSMKGTWSTVSGGYKSAYKIADASVEGNTATYSVRILRKGNYSFYGYWSGDSINNCGTAAANVSNGSINDNIKINQQKNIDQWNLLGIYSLNSGDTVVVKLTGSGQGNLVADAFRLRLNPSFSLTDYFMQDSQTVALKFSNNLLAPPSAVTKITSSLSEGDLNFNVDANNNSVLYVKLNNVIAGSAFNLNIKNLVDVSGDTLSVSVSLTYNPETSQYIVDDATANSFWKLMGSWVNDTSSSAVNNSCWHAKLSGKTARVQWGPYTIEEAGYYDVFVNIPGISLPLADCMYIIKDADGTDTVYAAQSSLAGSWLNIGNYSYNKGDKFSVMLSSTAATDTAKYIVADAVKLKRVLSPVSVDDEVIPERFKVSQNYPNPFNPATTISYTLPARGNVSVKVFNMLGQEVARLVNDVKEAGTYNVTWNAAGCSSGVYFYNVTYNDKSTVKKMILLK